ncbi:MAG: alpha/beta fold hydrolase, partial [Verrucomicrobia bacterium]
MGCLAAAAAVAGEGVAGHWAGAIELPGTALAIRIDLERADEDGAWGGRIDIPAQMVRGLALSEVVVEGDRVAFALPKIPGDPRFEGRLEDGRIRGEFRQSGQSFPFHLARAEPRRHAGETPSRGVPGTGLPGHWQGSLRVNAVELRLVLHVEAASDGALRATLDSIDQGVKGIGVSTISRQGDAVEIELAGIGARFSGKLSADGSEIEGRWKQGPVDAPLVFRRLAAAPELARPQEPERPYPYLEEQVTFRGGEDGVRLAGTLTLPRGEGPFPAVVLLSGSGPQDRDEALMGHRPFLVLADYLTRQGIAVLRFDDRGVGASTGDFATATHEDFARDAQAAFEFLRAHPNVDPARVGLCGHSEGAVHATLAAAAEPEVAFVVMLAGIGVPADRLVARQREDIIRAMGGAHVVSDEERRLMREVFALLRAEDGDEASLQAAVREKLRAVAAHYTPEQLAYAGLTDAMLEAQVKRLTSPWFRRLLAFDPHPWLARVRCPVLAVNGKKDLQVAWEENLEGIRCGLEAGGNRDVTIRALPGLNHLFQQCTTGLPSEYG